MEEFQGTVEEAFSDVQQRKKSILIVDDNVTYMSMIMDWLRDSYRVSMANSGVQAITWLAKNRVDLILLDYEMPVVDGPQVFQMLRQDPSTRGIPVVFLTGVGGKEQVERVLQLKPTGYILKSTTKEKLLNYLRAKL